MILRQSYTLLRTQTLSRGLTPVFSLGSARNYALSRYPERTSRNRLRVVRSEPMARSPKDVVEENQLLMESNPDTGGLEKLLANDALVVTRCGSDAGLRR